MQITQLRIKSYKSFYQSEDMRFSPGFNVIIGENNSGKTALLEALSLQFENKPHRSVKTLPYEGSRFVGSSSNIAVSFYLERDELHDLLVDYLPEFYIPYSGSHVEISQRKEEFLGWFNNQRQLSCVVTSGGLVRAGFTDDQTESITENSPTIKFRITRSDNEPQLIDQAGKNRSIAFLPWKLISILQKRIYAFRAERFHVGQCDFGDSKVLNSDASNLPEVINNLQSNHAGFDRYNQLVRLVFPTVTHVSVRAIPDKKVKIFVLTDPDREKDFLALPLQDSGTGLGQVLAMLYIIITSTYPQTILIDEPQSFLHPGAIRRLFSIFKQYPQHQYIVSTHSPIAVTSADPNTILLIQKEHDESKIEVIDKYQTEQLDKLLKQVGASLSDVFGADRILWVEGATEQICFPLIWTRLVRKPLLGTVILGVLHTGDFESNKQSDRAFQIYTRLSKGQSLIPPAIGFIFDKEDRTQEAQDDLIRRSKQENGPQTVFFTPRKMYENYLLNPVAIKAVLSNLKDYQVTPISAEAIESWFSEHAWDNEFFKPEKVTADRTHNNWLIKVHGKKVLKAIFQKFLIGIEYREVEHGEALTKWLLENKPEELQEIAELLMATLHMENKEDGQH